MTMTVWVRQFSVAAVGTALLTLGTANLTYAQTTTNTFDPAAPGSPIPNSGGLTFSGFVSATGGAGGAVAASNGSATVSPVPPATLFNFFGVSLSKPTGSSINFIQVSAVLNGASLYTRTVDVSAGSRAFQPTALGLPTTVSSLTFTGFATSPAAFSALAAPDSDTSAVSLASFSFSADESAADYSYGGYGGGYGGDYYGGHGGGYGGDDYYGGHKKKKNIAKCGYKNCDNVFFIDDLSTSAVPEPTSILGLLVASGGVAALKRKMGKKTAKKDETLV